MKQHTECKSPALAFHSAESQTDTTIPLLCDLPVDSNPKIRQNTSFDCKLDLFLKTYKPYANRALP